MEKRAKAEIAMARYKRSLGGHLQSRTLPAQQAQGRHRRRRIQPHD